MTLSEIIKGRRSIGAFLDTPVPERVVEELLETAKWAPNHHLTQPWRFIYITGEARRGLAEVRRILHQEASQSSDPEQVRAVGERAYQTVMSIPAFLAVVMAEHEDPHIREEDFAACCCLIQNFMLLAWERGIGTHWKTISNDPRQRAFLGLAPNEKLVGFLHLGYPARVPPPRERAPVRERITYIREASPVGEDAHSER